MAVFLALLGLWADPVFSDHQNTYSLWHHDCAPLLCSSWNSQRSLGLPALHPITAVRRLLRESRRTPLEGLIA